MSTAQEFARRHDAVLAVGRSAAARDSRPPAAGQPVSGQRSGQRRALSGLSSHRRTARPSPARLASSGSTVVGACLRNRTAVAQWLATQWGDTVAAESAGDGTPSPVVAIVAAGERWPDGSLRPATEDLWGAGAVIAALDSLGMTGLSPEARSAAGAWHAVEATWARRWPAAAAAWSWPALATPSTWRLPRN